MRGERGVAMVIVVALLAIAGAVAAAEPARDGRPTDQTDLFQSLSLGSRKEPVKINADALELDYRANTLTYSGNVHVTQGDVTLTSDRLAITYDRDAARRGAAPVARVAATSAAAGDETKPAAPAGTEPDKTKSAMPGAGDTDKIKEVVAEGHVRIHKGDRLAEGRRAVFDQEKQTIVLSDGAVLHEGPNQVAGDRIVVYLKEERSVVEGGSKSRVSAVFYPGTRDEEPPAPVKVGDAAGVAAGGAR